jgi:hypothetical protein
MMQIFGNYYYVSMCCGSINFRVHIVSVSVGNVKRVKWRSWSDQTREKWESSTHNRDSTQSLCRYSYSQLTGRGMMMTQAGKMSVTIVILVLANFGNVFGIGESVVSKGLICIFSY